MKIYDDLLRKKDDVQLIGAYIEAILDNDRAFRIYDEYIPSGESVEGYVVAKKLYDEWFRGYEIMQMIERQLRLRGYPTDDLWANLVKQIDRWGEEV